MLVVTNIDNIQMLKIDSADPSPPMPQVSVPGGLLHWLFDKAHEHTEGSDYASHLLSYLFVVNSTL